MVASGRNPVLNTAQHPAFHYFAAVACSDLLYVGSPQQLRLASWIGDAHWVWLVLLVALPGVGFLKMLAGRRFWAWPYLLLACLWLVPSVAQEDLVDRGALLVNAVLITLLLGLLESVGLATGRALARLLGLAYFALLAATLLLLAMLKADWHSFNWLAVYLLFAGLLFLVQAYFQLYKWQRLPREVSNLAAGQPHHHPDLDAKYLPWTVRVDPQSAIQRGKHHNQRD